MSKSHVGIEQKMCPVMGKPWDAGILLNKRLRNTLERNNLTGWEVCPEVKDKLDKGYLALVEIDYDRSTILENGNINPDGAFRLGGVCYLRRKVAEDMFGRKDLPAFVWTDSEMLEKLKVMMENAEKED